MIFNGAYQHSGIYMTRDFSTAFEIIRTLIIDRDRRNDFIDQYTPDNNTIKKAAAPIRKYQRTIVTDYGEGLHKQKVNADMDELELPNQETMDALLATDEDYKNDEE